MALIEDNVPAMVKGWQDKGLTVMALTSRLPNYRYATEREMTRAQYDMTVFHDTKVEHDRKKQYGSALTHFSSILLINKYLFFRKKNEIG